MDSVGISLEQCGHLGGQGLRGDSWTGTVVARHGAERKRARYELTLQPLALEGATPIWPKDQHFAVDISRNWDLPKGARRVGLWLSVLLLTRDTCSRVALRL